MSQPKLFSYPSLQSIVSYMSAGQRIFNIPRLLSQALNQSPFRMETLIIDSFRFIIDGLEIFFRSFGSPWGQTSFRGTKDDLEEIDLNDFHFTKSENFIIGFCSYQGRRMTAENLTLKIRDAMKKYLLYFLRNPLQIVNLLRIQNQDWDIERPYFLLRPEHFPLADTPVKFRIQELELSGNMDTGLNSILPLILEKSFPLKSLNLEVCEQYSVLLKVTNPIFKRINGVKFKTTPGVDLEKIVSYLQELPHDNILLDTRRNEYYCEMQANIIMDRLAYDWMKEHPPIGKKISAVWNKEDWGDKYWTWWLDTRPGGYPRFAKMEIPELKSKTFPFVLSRGMIPSTTELTVYGLEGPGENEITLVVEVMKLGTARRIKK